MKNKIILPFSFHKLASWEDIEIVSGEGYFLIDKNGKKYFDLNSGYSVVNMGYENEEIINEINKLGLYSYLPPIYYNQYIDSLGKLLLKISNGNFDTILRCVSGSEAVDLSLQLSFNYTKRNKFIVIGDSYHGNTGLLNISSDKKVILKYDANDIRKTENELYGLLISGEIAAIIIEGFSTSILYNFYDISFIKFLRKVTEKTGTLLIFDGIADSFGKVGYTFTYEHYDIIPDILCLGKAMSGGYIPISAILTHKKFSNNFEYYSSYGWTPCACLISEIVINKSLEKGLNKNSVVIFNEVTNFLNENINKEKLNSIYGAGCIIVIELKGNFAYYLYKELQKKGILTLYDCENLNKLILMPQQEIDINVLKDYLSIIVSIVNGL